MLRPLTYNYLLPAIKQLSLLRVSGDEVDLALSLSQVGVTGVYRGDDTRQSEAPPSVSIIQDGLRAGEEEEAAGKHACC